MKADWSKARKCFNAVASRSLGGFALALPMGCITGQFLGYDTGLVAAGVSFLVGYLLAKRYGGDVCRRVFKRPNPGQA